MRLKTLILSLIVLPIYTNAQFITTIAGNGVGSFAGDGGAATAAEIYNPSDVITDATGNVYITDYNNSRIRKINTSGIISTIAGNGSAAFSGDGGPATAAAINHPNGIILDGSNILFADYYNNCIRKINASGIITTIAGSGGTAGFSGDGGPATLALLNLPVNLCLDPSGNLYFTDANNHRIRKINTSGIISTIGGTGIPSYSGDGGPATLAEFNNPYGVAMDAAGNLYIGDQSNNRIREINTSGIVTTYAGTGIAGYTGDGGPASVAQLNLPTQVYFDPYTSELYFADRLNNCARKISTTGIITTVVGNGTAGFSGDGGPATAARANNVPSVFANASGNIFIGDFGNNRIREIVNCLNNISGAGNVCVGANTTLSSSTPGGTWSSATTTVAAISGGGVITGIASGTSVISYFSSCGVATTTITVNPNPGTITGLLTVCSGSAVLFSDSPSGGTWSSSNPSIATIAAGTGLVTGVATGSAIISYYTPSGCFTTTTVAVNPPLSTITGNLSVCAGSITQLSDVTGPGTWSSGTTGIATIDASGSVSGITAGSATITYTAGSGCYTTTTVIVNQVPTSIIGLSGVCIGSATTLSDAIPGGTWSSNNTSIATVTAGTGIVTGVSAGTDIITYTLNGNCYITYTVNVNAPPPAIAGNFQICAGQTTALTDATTGGTWSSATSAIATVGATSGVVIGNTAGTAIISYAVNNCIVTTSVVVNTTPGSISGQPNVCEGSVISLSDSPPGGTWSSNNTAIATVTSSAGLVTGASVGTAVITYTLAGGCYRTASVTVNALPGAIQGPASVCSGQTIDLSDAVTGGTWASSTSSVATVESASGIVAGDNSGISVITYFAGGCSVTTTITVNPTPVPITGPASVCSGSTIQLSDNPAGGMWSSSNSTVATVTIGTVFSTSPGTTVITYSLAGCFRTVTITVNPVPSPIAGNTLVCEGATVVLTDTLSGGLWSSSSTSVATVSTPGGIVSGVSHGTTVVTYGANGCITTVSVTVNITPTVTTGFVNICTDGIKILNSGPTGGLWSSSNTNVATIVASGTGSGTVYGIAPGTTIISYTLGSCYKTTTVTAVAILPPLAGNTSVCSGRLLSLSDSIPTGTWTSSNASVATVDSNTGLITGVHGGADTITYSLGGSCIVSATVTINQSPGAGVITGNPDVCIEAITMLSDTVAGGLWSSSNTGTSVSAGSVSGLSAGMDTISYIVSNTHCADTATRVVTVYPLPDTGLISGPSIVCTGSSFYLSDAISGGIWNSAITSVATISAIGKVTGISGGIDTIKYIVSNPGCSDTAHKTVTVYDLPNTGTITGQDTVCTGARFTLAATTTGGKWTSDNTSVATIDSISGIVYAAGSGTVTITYTTGPNAGGCYNDTTFSITVNDQGGFSVSSNVTPIKCYGDTTGSITLDVTNGTPPFTYLWSNAATTQDIAPLVAGTYSVIITQTATQCRAVDTITVPTADSLSFTATINSDLCSSSNGSIALDVSGGTAPYNYAWSNSMTTKEIEGLAAGSYSVVVTDNNNCITEMSFTVKGDTCNNLVIHDVITPNGDGINDKWVIEGITIYPKNTVQIFDKWGNMVYEKNGYNNDWEGTWKNGLLPDGTYYYLVKLNAENVKGGQNTWTGTLLIKR